MCLAIAGIVKAWSKSWRASVRVRVGGGLVGGLILPACVPKEQEQRLLLERYASGFLNLLVSWLITFRRVAFRLAELKSSGLRP